MIWQVKYTDESQKDLDAIYEYIAFSLSEADIAKKLVNSLLDEIRSLNNMPGRYRLYDNEPWYSYGLRVMPVKNYLVFYRPVEKEKTVYILKIMYGGRDIKNQLNETIK